MVKVVERLLDFFLPAAEGVDPTHPLHDESLDVVVLAASRPDLRYAQVGQVTNVCQETHEVNEDFEFVVHLLVHVELHLVGQVLQLVHSLPCLDRSPRQQLVEQLLGHRLLEVVLGNVFVALLSLQSQQIALFLLLVGHILVKAEHALGEFLVDCLEVSG